MFCWQHRGVPGKAQCSNIWKKIPPQGYLVKYKSVQSVDTGNEYFKQIYKLLLEDDSVFGFYGKYFEKTKGAVKKFISKIRGISLDGIEIDPNEKIDYFDECKTLLKALPFNFETLLLLIDEFPDAVSNISSQNKANGIRFLQLIRELRQDLDAVRLQFVYSGSIGLGNVVKKLNRIDLINDIVNIKLPPLSRAEAKGLIGRLVQGLQADSPAFEISEQLMDYILDKESWHIPYYIQIIVDEFYESCKETQNIPNEQNVDQTIHKIITDRYQFQDYFENWKTRLRQALDAHEYSCAVAILNIVASQGSIDFDAIHDLSVRHDVQDAKSITNVLEYDGYLSRDSRSLYRFNSIILKKWWYLNVAG
ncbi:MAG: hypothetical protein GY846_06495 [Deltaproteobacteria bacterium]|nr:hypothetical protein [Deltaproteobacteria bacterium]